MNSVSLQVNLLINEVLTAFLELKKEEKKQSQKDISQHAVVDFNYIQFCIELI